MFNALIGRHGGDMPGFTTQITRLPALGIGFYVGINDDDVGAMLKATIVYRLLDDVLGLGAIDWEERLVTSHLRKAASYTPIPDKPRPAPPTKSLVGKYYDKGYGSFELMTFEEPSSQLFASRFTDKNSLTAYLRAVKKAITAQAGLSEPLMIAASEVLGSVYVFSHFDGPIYNKTTMEVAQNPQGDWTSFTSGGGHNTAVFVEGRGMGMFENFWGGHAGKRAVEQDVEEQAEVWFCKDE